MTETNAQLPAPLETPPPARQKLWPVWLVALLALILAIGLALWSWQQWQTQQLLSQQLASVENSTRQLQQNFGQSGSERADRLSALETRLGEQRELLATQQRQIDHNAQQLLEAGNRTRTDWLLAEAEFLLRIANQRLLVEKDIRGALAALQEADSVLLESDDVGVYAVRQQLAKEVLALKGIAGVDRTGLYLTLEAAIDSVNQLTDDALIHDRAPAFTGSGDEAEPIGDQGMLANAWYQLKTTLGNVIVVRRLDEPVKPLLSPDQSAYARLNLQLMLEEAEMAVLRGNQPLFERALGKAATALGQWYDRSDQRIVALARTLTELATRNVDPELPDISRSLSLLKARLAGRLGNGEAAASGEGDAS